MEYLKIQEVLEALQKGRLVLVIDDKDRENEGDLICSAQAATTENVNFMATYAKGLICMPMSERLAKTIQIIIRRLLQFQLIIKKRPQVFLPRKED